VPYRLSGARILDFDIENRPLSYWVPDRPSAEITAIAWSFEGERNYTCALLGDRANYSDELWDKPGLIVFPSVAAILEAFVGAYNQADIVTGHYIRRHDLPIINGALIENGLPILEQKLTSDTKIDLVRKQDLPVSQEALAAYLGIKAPKVQMTQADWRDANRLTETGLARTYKRVVGDIRQHKQMRAELIRRGLVRAPKMWRP
jgi:hypothetical protein